MASRGEVSWPRVEKLLRSGDTLAQSLNEPYADALVRLARATASVLCGRWKSAQALCDQCEPVFRTSCAGASWEVDTANRFAILCLANRGEIKELVHRLPTLLKEARERGNLYAETNLITSTMSLPALAADEPEHCRDELHDCMRRWSQRGFHLQHLVCAASESRVDVYAGDGRAALDRLNACWPLFVHSHLIRIAQLRIALFDDRARAALSTAAASADRADFVRRAQSDAARIAREKDQWARPIARLLQAGICRLRGRSDAAVDLLKEAIDLSEARDMLLHAAVARRRLAQLVGGDQGRELHDAGTVWMASQGIRNPARMTALFAPGYHDG